MHGEFVVTRVPLPPHSEPSCTSCPQYLLIGAPTIPSRLRAVPYLTARERESRCLAGESFRYRVCEPTFIQRMKTEESTDFMASLANALKEEIGALARREVRRQTAPADKAMARCARDIAALQREVQALEHELASSSTPLPGLTVPPKKPSDRTPRSRRAASKVSATSTSAKPSPRRQFSGDALKAHRERLWAVCEQLRQAHRRLGTVDLQLGAGQGPPAQEQRRRLDRNPENGQAPKPPDVCEPQVG